MPLIILAALTVFGGLLNLPKLHTFTLWLEHTIEFIHPGEFVILVASLSSGLAIFAFILTWLLYSRRYRQLQELPLARRPDDPLRQILGPVFTGMENKWWVDELYWAIILNPYVVLSRFMATVVDWRFWHDWFHDTVIARSFQRLTQFLAKPVDLGVIDGIANGLANATVRLGGSLRRVQTGFVRNYALSVFLGVVLIIGYLILR
jgi:NADH-quinone oxidoreductase subunit L